MTVEAVVSKWGNPVSVRIPAFLQKEMDLHVNEKVELTFQDNSIIIKKPKRTRTLQEIVQQKTGMTLEEYADQNAYDNSDYVDFGRVGSEEI